MGRNSLCLIDKLSLPPKYKYFIRFYLKDSLFDLLQNVGSRTVQVPARPPCTSSTVSEDVFFFSKEKQGPSAETRSDLSRLPCGSLAEAGLTGRARRGVWERGLPLVRKRPRKFIFSLVKTAQIQIQKLPLGRSLALFLYFIYIEGSSLLYGQF